MKKKDKKQERWRTKRTLQEENDDDIRWCEKAWDVAMKLNQGKGFHDDKWKETWKQLATCGSNNSRDTDKGTLSSR